VRDGDTVRHIYNKGWAGLDSADLVCEALRELSELNWARKEQARPTAAGGRPSEIVRLHPSLRYHQ